MARKSPIWHLLQLIPDYILKESKVKVITSSTMPTLTKKYLLFIISNKDNEDIEHIENEWIKKQGLSSYKIKALRKQARSFLAKILEDFYLSTHKFYEHYSNQISLLAYLSMVSNEKLSSFNWLIDIPSDINAIYEDIRWQYAPEWMYLNIVHAPNIILGKFNNFEDLEHFINDVYDKLLCHVESSKVIYFIHSLANVPFVEKKYVTSQWNTINTIIQLIFDNKKLSYSNSHALFMFINAFPILYWLQFTTSLEYMSKRLLETLDYLADSKQFSLKKILSNPSYYNVLRHVARYIYGLIYSNCKDERLTNYLEKILDVSQSIGLPAFNLQLLHVILEGARWSLMNGNIKLFKQLQSFIDSYLPPQKPNYIHRLTYQLDMLFYFITNPNSSDFKNSIELYRKNPYSFAPSPFTTLWAANLAEFIYYLNTNNIQGVIKMGERIYQLCYRNSKAIPLGKLIRNIGNHIWHYRPRSFWSAIYNQAIQIYRGNPLYLSLERYFPLLAWFIHKEKMVPIKEILKRDYIQEAGLSPLYVEKTIKSILDVQLPAQWKDRFEEAAESVSKTFSKR